MKKNILVTGIGQTNYLFQLYGNIVPKLQQFNFNSVNLKGLENLETKNKAEHIFNLNYQYNYDSIPTSKALEGFFILIRNSYFWKDHRIMLAELGWKYFEKSWFLTKIHMHAYYYARFIDQSTKSDIIHHHFLNHKQGLFLKYLTKSYKIIESYWGSDLFRIANWQEHEIQKELLSLGNIITVATPEMKFGVLSRFGDDFSKKIRIIRFILNETFYEQAKSFLKSNNWQKDYKSGLNIPENKIIILYGHNAVKENNHVKFIEVLKKLPPEIISKFHIIFPLTYGNSTNDHIEWIKENTSEIDTEFTFIEKYMDWEMLAKIKIISDVYIHAPITDGLSGFLTEYFYTNNLAIVGGWLPYKTFTDMGIKYLEFEDFSALKDILINLPTHIKTFKNIKNKNKEIVVDQFSVDKTAVKWENIFKEIEV